MSQQKYFNNGIIVLLSRNNVQANDSNNERETDAIRFEHSSHSSAMTPNYTQKYKIFSLRT